MIHEFHVQNYKALRDVRLKLTPMHVLIGPNDSGKTSILEALGALCRSVEMPLSKAFRGPWQGAELVTDQDPSVDVVLGVHGTSNANASFSYQIALRFLADGATVQVTREEMARDGDSRAMSVNREHSNIFRTDSNALPEDVALAGDVREALRNSHQYSWRPRELALPVAPDQSRYLTMEYSGFGLAQLLDDVVGDDIRRYSAIEDDFRRVFPDVERIAIHTTKAYRVRDRANDEVEQLSQQDGRGIYFVMKRGQFRLRAAHASDGMLFVLAYLALRHSPQSPSLLLLEEPENGIHPQRLKDLMSILRELVAESSRTQVIMTTHSPYLVDLFKPEEVTLCFRDEYGDVRTQRLDESPIVNKLMKTFTLGEIWSAEEDVVRAEALNGGVAAQP